LRYLGSRGDLAAESRGGSEDREFKKAYRDFFSQGSYNLSSSLCRATLTSKEAKLKKKHENIAGLQLADLLAHPGGRATLTHFGRLPTQAGQFSQALCAALQPKYNRRFDTGAIGGYGRVLMT
jgi:hypothetical protein